MSRHLVTSLTSLGAALFAGSSVTAQAETVLPAQTVEVRRDVRPAAETSYQAGQTRIGKQDALPINIPQAVTIVPEKLMTERNAHTLKEALRNVPSLTFNAGEGGRIGDNITIRGYSAVGDLYLDNIRDIAQYNRETFNLEQVDVLRGSASMLFGRGSTGGVINQVSKEPVAMDMADLALTVGSFDYVRTTADLNHRINPETAFRINLMSTRSDGFRSNAQKRYGVAPSIKFGIDTPDEFTLSYYYLDDDNVPDFGVPYFQGRPVPVPVTRFYGLSEVDFERSRASIATVKWQHQFNPGNRLVTTLRQGRYERDLWGVAPRLPGGTSAPITINDDTPVNRNRQARGGEEDSRTLQLDYTSRLMLGGMTHELLAGAEVLREQSNRWTNTGYAPGTTTLIPNPATTIGNPAPNPVLPAGYQTITRTAPNSYNSDTLGLYVQDTISLNDQWKWILGARHDTLDARYQRTPTSPQMVNNDYDRKDSEWSYRTGILYQPTSSLSYYASYGTSFNPSAELYQLDDRSVNTPPEKNRNLEAGIKADVLDNNLSLRAAVFRSEKTNERNTDVSSPDVFLLSGARRTDGIELEAAGRITPRWEAFASASFMDAEVTAGIGNNSANVGKRPINTPDYTASLWSTYLVAPRWKVGAGIEAVGERFANASNATAVPAYTRVDGMVSYDNRDYSIRLNAHNLLDRDYYESVYPGHIVPGTTRNLQLTFEYRY